MEGSDLDIVGVLNNENIESAPKQNRENNRFRLLKTSKKKDELKDVKLVLDDTNLLFIDRLLVCRERASSILTVITAETEAEVKVEVEAKESAVKENELYAPKASEADSNLGDLQF